MENPIPTYGWVATPENFGVIQDLIAASGDPATGTLVMIMTLNLCHEMVNRANEKEPYPEAVQPV